MTEQDNSPELDIEKMKANLKQSTCAALKKIDDATDDCLKALNNLAEQARKRGAPR